MLSEKELKWLQGWFAISDDGLKPLEEAYIKGETDNLYSLTQEYYRRNKVSEIRLYRWETGKRNNKKLTSWSHNKFEAESYKTLRGEGKLLEKVVPVKDILFTTDIDYVEEWDIYWDELLGMYPMEECILKGV